MATLVKSVNTNTDTSTGAEFSNFGRGGGGEI